MSEQEDEDSVSIDPRYIVTRKDKRTGKVIKFVRFPGLMEEGHKQGLKAIQTVVEQIPSTTNGRMAVVRATVETAKGSFSGIGDASPESVTDLILPHLLRMSETRAIARALRWATNIPYTALEELGNESESDDTAPARPAETGSEDRPASKTLASDKQMKYVNDLASKLGYKTFEEPVDFARAKFLIDSYSKELREKKGD